MKFRVGEIYKDREGREHRLIAHVPETREASQLVFLELKTSYISGRYPSGCLYEAGLSFYDILPHKKKTVKLYPALYKTNAGKYYSGYLYEECPEDAIRFLTEYPPVIIEVEDE